MGGAPTSDLVLSIVIFVGAIVIALWQAYRRNDFTRVLREVGEERNGTMRGDVLHLRVEGIDIAISVDAETITAEIVDENPMTFVFVRRSLLTKRAVLAVLDRVVESRPPTTN